MSHGRPAQSIAVVIATRGRLAMLSQRSLPSVANQTRRPDFLVVADDSRTEARQANAQLITSFSLPACKVAYIENQRTEGASGAWNTALQLLAARVDDPERVFVAVLDDDDSWHPSYLEGCAAAVRDGDLDMVAADLRRFESRHETPIVESAPEQLLTGDFLAGNPGIQGSNLFVRLSVLLAAGAFDEALPSSTDRDLCIRIADLGSVRYRRLPMALVDHFAEPDRERLSTRGSTSKLEGLTAFWRKYVGRMTVDQRRAFSARAGALFDWQPPLEPAENLLQASRHKKALVIGLIADHQHPDLVLEAVTDLVGVRDDTLVGLDVVLLEAGIRCEGLALIDVAASRLRDSGVGCFRLTLERQDNDAAGGLFRVDGHDPGARPSAERERRRDMLRVYGTRIAEARTGTELWMADHDGQDEPPRSQPSVQALLHRLRADPVAWSHGPSQHVSAEVLVKLDRWIQQERVSTAEHRVKRRFSLAHLRLLGFGAEAVVFTDGSTVYKCIDYWKTRMPRSQFDFLKRQVGRWEGVPGLYALRGVVEDGPWAVLTYDYEASTPYKGGFETDLIRFLNGCADAGVVCNNVHPKNLVLTPGGVKLIDYGSDIRPWSALGFEHMARRAYLACGQAAHPDLKDLMRRALNDLNLPEMDGYASFRAQLDGDRGRAARIREGSVVVGGAAKTRPFLLHVGVITSAPATLRPLLRGLASLRKREGAPELSALVLDNGSPQGELDGVIRGARRAGLSVAVVEVARQQRDATDGAFGKTFRSRPDGQVGIAQARTMLQRYLGALVTLNEGAFAWVLDDDMRVDDRARAYLRWLPAFRDQGVDVLLGAYEGSSPNPPLNGIRVHLVDLLHNVHWLRGLPRDAVLPDRAAENAALRARYPDYYYDLSRKHTGHLEMPHWLEPVVPGETVGEAYARLLAGALGILSGDPLTRPIVAVTPPDPLTAANDSVNRGGCTFVLNPRALTQTPNTIALVHGREARRSDMVWAIVNRYYRRMTIKAVAFPVHHVGRVDEAPSLNVEKIRGEIVGSTLYGGITEFLKTHPDHDLDFLPGEAREIRRLADEHLERRWRALESSFRRIAGLSSAIRNLAGSDQLRELCGYLDRWFTPEGLHRIRSGVGTHASRDVEVFLASLRGVADDFASTTVPIDFIQAQLEAQP